MLDGDVVIVRIQTSVESGETAIVSVGGDQAICRRVKKTPYGIMKRALRQGIPCIAIGGSVMLGDGDDVSGFDAVVPVTPPDMPLEEAMRSRIASSNVCDAVRKIVSRYE